MRRVWFFCAYCWMMASAQAEDLLPDAAVAAAEQSLRGAFVSGDAGKLDAMAAYPVRNKEFEKDGRLDKPAELKRAFDAYRGLLQKEVPADQEWSFACLANAKIQPAATPQRYSAFCPPLEFSFKKSGNKLKLIAIDNVNE